MGLQNGTARRKEATAKAARDQVVLENLSLVKAIAVRVHEKLLEERCGKARLHLSSTMPDEAEFRSQVGKVVPETWAG